MEEQVFLTAIEIKKVRHLQNIHIPLSDTKRKHLILTGKNGCGKTSVLTALAEHFQYVVSQQFQVRADIENSIAIFRKEIEKDNDTEAGRIHKGEKLRLLRISQERLKKWTSGVVSSCTSFQSIRDKYTEGKFIFAYYRDRRQIEMEPYKDIQQVELKPVYSMDETPGAKLCKYLVNLKAMQAFANQDGDHECDREVNEWFERFERILQVIFDDTNIKLEFNKRTYQFSIVQTGHEPFDFNTMSSGYAAIFDIINDLLMRMEAQKNYNLQGVVLVDEIETHLHLELQKKILPVLNSLFPNIQFIISTHSPFILNSLDNTVVYDLENGTLVSNGMTNLPYGGIVEGYFGADRLSAELRQKLERYKLLAVSTELSDEDFAELDELEMYLDEIPDYLACDIAAEYRRLKLELNNRLDKEGM